MPIAFKHALPIAAVLLVVSPAAQASDAADIARGFNLPVPVVETVLHNVDAYFASPDAPDNRMTSGLIKELALKALKTHMNHLEEGGPGRASESTAEKENATYKVTFRTTRHEATEVAECVEAAAQVATQEGVPVVKDGAFTFDKVHPRTTSFSWRMTFCRTPLNGGGDYTDWQLK